MGLTEISPGVLLSYGQLALPLALLAGALGAPLPGTLLLLAAGALSHAGTFDLLPVVGLALLGVVPGDVGGYLLGRYGGSLAERASSDGRAGGTWQKARDAFDRRGGSAVFLTRFLLTPLAVPTNLVAGGSGYPFRRFLAFDVAGEAVWVGLFVGLGYLFGGSWEALGTAANTLTRSLVAATALALGAYGAYRRLPGHGIA